MPQDHSTCRALGVAVSLLLTPCLGGQVQRWVSSDGYQNWKDQPPPALAPYDGETVRMVIVDEHSPAQEIDGFGACFNERGWDSLGALDQARRQEILKELFDPNGDGCRFTLGRMPIGASDYAMDWYSLADTPEDFSLKDFSLTRDRKYLIPYIKAALAQNPNLHIWGSPWSPPAWMKKNGRYAARADLENGRLRQEPAVQEAYARYLGRYVQEYRKEGIPVYAVHVQNEPAADQVFPSCLWNGAEMRDFLRDYLIPHFLKEKIGAELWLGTLNHGDVQAYAGLVFADPFVREHVKGVGYQWDGKHAIADTARLYPEKRLMQTESECGNGSNDKAAGLYTYGLLCHYLKRGANSYLYWNMVLDKGGYSTWSWSQNSLISIERYNQGVTYHFEYFVLRHLSRHVQVGARRLHTQGADDRSLAFRNPDGSLVLVALNPMYTASDFRFKMGDQMLRATLAPESLNTFVIAAAP